MTPRAVERQRARAAVISAHYLLAAPFLGATTAVAVTVAAFFVTPLLPSDKVWTGLPGLIVLVATAPVAGHLVRHLRTSSGSLFALITYAAIADSLLFVANPLSPRLGPPTALGLLVTTLTGGAVTIAKGWFRIDFDVYVFILAVAFWQGFFGGRRRADREEPAPHPAPQRGPNP
jgi:hypothetical protein